MTNKALVTLAYGIMILVTYPHASISASEVANSFPGNKSEYRGFNRYDFSFDGYPAFVITPHRPAIGRPWIWRARFPEYKNQADLALLGKGYHIAYISVINEFGSPTAVKRWDMFYKYLTEQHGLSKKPVLEGVSRGGLIVYNWATQNPDKVSAIVCLVPVLDFKSWPGQKDDYHWKLLLRAYGLTEDEALAYSGNPIDHLLPIIEKNIPILHIVGSHDESAPYEENTKIMEDRYRNLGGSMQVIMLEGGHDVGLTKPTRIVQFILKHTQ